jgi:threonine/homoserine/homoserine lactone efflux protein
MPAHDILLTFFGIAVLLALAPGPDNIFVMMQSAIWGRSAGFIVVLGLCTGLLGHTAAVAVGLAAVFAASPAAFTLLKLLGATYLAWLAWQAFRAPTDRPPGADGAPRLRPWRLYLRGIVMNLTNPKVSLFFLAFLPQFTDPAAGPVGPQIVVLGGLFMLATLLVFGAIAIFSGAAGALLQRSAFVRKLLNRAAGVIFLGLALRLATAAR